jgi:hypothetical protein
MGDIADNIKWLVASHLGIDVAKVTAEASFTDDLGADSLDTVELVLAFEKPSAWRSQKKRPISSAPCRMRSTALRGTKPAECRRPLPPGLPSPRGAPSMSYLTRGRWVQSVALAFKNAAARGVVVDVVVHFSDTGSTEQKAAANRPPARLNKGQQENGPPVGCGYWRQNFVDRWPGGDSHRTPGV